MKFGKKKTSIGGKTSETQALTLVLESSERAMYATDYGTGIRTWTAVLMPAFSVLSVAPPYFSNLFSRLKELSKDPKKSASTRDLAGRAYQAANRAGEHLQRLAGNEANREAEQKSARKKQGASKASGRKISKRDAYPDDERLARAMVNNALKEQIEGLEREAAEAAKNGRASEADTLRRRRLVYQAEHDRRHKPTKRAKPPEQQAKPHSGKAKDAPTDSPKKRAKKS